MPKVTLKDIAREVGLSPTSVSLVLNNRPCSVSEENRRTCPLQICEKGRLFCEARVRKPAEERGAQLPRKAGCS